MQLFELIGKNVLVRIEKSMICNIAEKETTWDRITERQLAHVFPRFSKDIPVTPGRMVPERGGVAISESVGARGTKQRSQFDHFQTLVPQNLISIERKVLISVCMTSYGNSCACRSHAVTKLSYIQVGTIRDPS